MGEILLPDQPVEPSPTAVPPRPATGAVITSAWGGETHDRVYTPMGVLASGPQLGNITGVIRLPLSTVAYGNAEFLDAFNNRIVIPVGAGGLYKVMGYVTCAGTGWARIQARRDGSNIIGQSMSSGMPPTAHVSFEAVYSLAEGAVIDFTGEASVATNMTCVRCGVVRIGNNLSSSLP